MKTVTIVGVGRVGGALALALPPTKYDIVRLVVRDAGQQPPLTVSGRASNAVATIADLATIDSDIVFITTPDDRIGMVADDISRLIVPRSYAFHTSGSLSSSVLGPLAEAGCPVGSIHPLVSISTVESGPEKFSGAYFCIEGMPEASTVAHEIVSDLGGTPFSIASEMKPLYHAAAVMSSGHLVALIDAATELLTKCGVDHEFASKILAPLIDSTIANLRSQGASPSLTGTFARGDLATFERHLAALGSSASDETRAIYLMLGLRSLDLALANGADPRAVNDIRDRIAMEISPSG